MVHDFKRFPELTNSQMQIYYFESPHKQIVDDFTAKVVKVTDGDTIRVGCDFRDFDFPIRLSNIAAPELKEGGANSQSWLEDEILGENVYVIVDKDNRVGKWGRLLGEIISDGVNINQESIRAGHSVSWDARKSSGFQDFFKTLEARE